METVITTKIFEVKNGVYKIKQHGEKWTVKFLLFYGNHQESGKLVTPEEADKLFKTRAVDSFGYPSVFGQTDTPKLRVEAVIRDHYESTEYMNTQYYK